MSLGRETRNPWLRDDPVIETEVLHWRGSDIERTLAPEREPGCIVCRSDMAQLVGCDCGERAI